MGNGGDDRVGDGESEARLKKRYTPPNEDDRVSTAGEQTELKQPQSVRQAVGEMAGFDKGSPTGGCLVVPAGDVLLNDAGATSVTWSEEPAASG